jgi:hypothetical protein
MQASGTNYVEPGDLLTLGNCITDGTAAGHLALASAPEKGGDRLPASSTVPSRTQRSASSSATALMA